MPKPKPDTGKYLILLLAISDKNQPYVWQYWRSDVKKVNPDVLVDFAAEKAKMRAEDFRRMFQPAVTVVAL